MNGTMPEFLNTTSLPDGYFDAPDPYSLPPASGVNLLELSKYARKHGKKLADLSKEEVDSFAIQPVGV